MNGWRWWLWKWALATQERDFHSWGLKNFAETALSADSFQSFMHNKMHFVLHFTDCLDFPLSPFVTSQPCSRWLSRWGGGSCWRWCGGWPGWPGPWSRGGRRWWPWWPCWSGEIMHCSVSIKKIYKLPTWSSIPLLHSSVRPCRRDGLEGKRSRCDGQAKHFHKK